MESTSVEKAPDSPAGRSPTTSEAKLQLYHGDDLGEAWLDRSHREEGHERTCHTSKCKDRRTIRFFILLGIIVLVILSIVGIYLLLAKHEHLKRGVSFLDIKPPNVSPPDVHPPDVHPPDVKAPDVNVPGTDTLKALQWLHDNWIWLLICGISGHLKPSNLVGIFIALLAIPISLFCCRQAFHNPVCLPCCLIGLCCGMFACFLAYYRLLRLSMLVCLSQLAHRKQNHQRKQSPPHSHTYFALK